MKKNLKKRPEDYPAFSFRLTDDEKVALKSEIERALAVVRKYQGDDVKLHNRNDVIVAALLLGLKAIIRQKRL